MSHLLDTNVFIHLMSGHPTVRQNFKQLIDDGSPLFLSSIVYFELCYGVEKSARVEANRVRLTNLIGSDFNCLLSIASRQRLPPISALDLISESSPSALTTR